MYKISTKAIIYFFSSLAGTFAYILFSSDTLRCGPENKEIKDERLIVHQLEVHAGPHGLRHHAAIWTTKARNGVDL